MSVDRRLLVRRQQDQSLSQLVRMIVGLDAGISDAKVLQVVPVNQSVEIQASNPQRVKFAIYNLGPGDLYWSSKPEAAGGRGFPILAAGGPTNPFIDKWPFCHRGPVYVQASIANTQLVFVEWVREEPAPRAYS